MFFYRAKPVEAKTKKELLETVCPICDHKPLSQDRWIAFRYSPMAMFRGLFLSFAIALLISLALLKIETVWVFLSQFTYSAQERIVVVFLACISIPAAFTVIHWEIKLGHLSEDDQHAIGVRCKHCGNAFVGLWDAFPESKFHDSRIVNEPENELEEPESSDCSDFQ